MVRSLRESGSRSTIYKQNHDGEYDSSKLIDLTPNTEILYNYVVEQGDSPRNLSYFDGIFYWFPPSQHFIPYVPDIHNDERCSILKIFQ